jgi:hypothetical protein
MNTDAEMTIRETLEWAAGSIADEIVQHGAHTRGNMYREAFAALDSLAARAERAERALITVINAPLPQKGNSAERIAELYAAARLAARVVMEEWG